MTNQQPNNPLHGITLEHCLTRLVEHYGWDEMASRIRINCFKKDPSIKSSLKFLRKTQWARNKIEDLYVATFSEPGTKVNRPDAVQKTAPDTSIQASGTASKTAGKSKPASTSPSPWANSTKKFSKD